MSRFIKLTDKEGNSIFTEHSDIYTICANIGRKGSNVYKKTGIFNIIECEESTDEVMNLIKEAQNEQK